jgi:thiol-disulfide isomerase/thioredoxin
MRLIKSLYSMAFGLMTLTSVAQEGFTVNFRLKGLGNHNIRVYHQLNGKYKLDTIKSAGNDLVIWKGSTPEPQIVRIDVLDTTQYLYVGKAVSMQPQLSFMLTNSVIDVKGNAKESFAAEVTGKDPDVKAYEQFHKTDIPLSRETWTIQQALNRKMNMKDTIGTGSMKDRMNQLRKRNQALRSEYIDQNPKAFASLCMLQTMGLLFTPEQMYAKFNSLDVRLTSSATGRAVLERIESNRNTATGKPVITIRQKGLDGNLVDVNALAGKVVLIDFWGSWCVPCRLSHPSMKELYATYKDRGFEIIGVANEIAGGPKPLETQLEKWQKAISEDGIGWKHILYDPTVADLVKQYDIMGYPTKFLVGKDGKFIMRILGNSPQSHEMLQKKLEELLPAK